MSDTDFIKWIASLRQTGEKEYLQNENALKDLKEKQTKLNDILMISGGLAAAGMLVSSPAALVASASTYFALEASITVDRLVSVIEMLLTAFSGEGITITPCVKTDEGLIDLLVRMPDRRTFAFMLRSKGDSLVKWRGDRQEFYVSTRKKGGKKNNKWADLLKLSQRLNAATLLLKKQKNMLVGSSNTERNKITVKAIVLTSKTRVDPNNDESVFVNFGDCKVLRVKTESVLHIVNQSDLINFLTLTEKS
jgi:hypothetical protein